MAMFRSVSNTIVYFIAIIALIRGFFAFVFIPLLWLFSSSNQALLSFWEEYFFDNGISVFNLDAVVLSFGYFLGFLVAIIFLLMRKDSIFQSLKYGTTEPSGKIILFAYMLTLVWVTLKLYTVVYNTVYFSHPFFNNSFYNHFSAKVLTHFFLPNAIFISSAFLLFLSKTKINSWLGSSMFILSILATLNYGSRGLFISSSILFFFAYLIKTNKVNSSILIKLFTFFLFSILIIFYMSNYGDLIQSLSGLIMRLDVYYIISHIIQSNEVMIGVSNNEYFRDIGVVSSNDYNTGVGYPAFLFFSISYPFSALAIGSLSALFIFLLLSVDSLPIRAVCLWFSIYFAFHWTEMSLESIIHIFQHVFIIILLYVAFSFIHRRKYVKNFFNLYK